MKNLQFITGRTLQEFDQYGFAYNGATKGTLNIDSNFLRNSYRVVYVVDSKSPNEILAGFTINTECEKNCRYLSVLNEYSRNKCINDLKILNISLSDLAECVAIFCSPKLDLIEHIRVFVQAINMSKETGKKATLAGSYIPSFKKSLHSVYHKELFEGDANNGKNCGLYVDYNNLVIQHLLTAIPLYLVNKISRQTSKVATRIAASLFF